MTNYHDLNINSSAPGKITLFGEHFVVYGNPAIIAAINKRISITLKSSVTNSITIRFGEEKLTLPTFRINTHTVETFSNSFLYPILKCITNVWEDLGCFSGLEVSIESQIPYGEGLGSSAASCVAIMGALGSILNKGDKTTIFESASQAERMIHENSSGADCYASTYGGILLFRPSSGNTRIKVEEKLLFLVSSTCIKHKTRDLVTKVKKLKEKNPTVFKELADSAKNICVDAKRALKEGDQQTLGNLLTENHKLLQKLHVSHPKVDELIETFMKSGALGCKLTGAGGGGAVIALFPNNDNYETLSEIRKKVPDLMLAELDYTGIQVVQNLNSEKISNRL
jgi:mevalonate kinase